MLRIGTRASPLAIIQAETVKFQLMIKLHLPETEIELVPMTTTGDTIKDRQLIELGGKGLFTKEIEEALLRREIDLAVHSMKDVATKLPEGLIIPCCLSRDDVRDAWISPVAKHPKDLPPGSKVGTASLRRGSQILHMNPHVEIVTLRGNVGTRIAKIEEGYADGTLLAMAGLNRLGLEDLVTQVMNIEEVLPAPAQGALGLQCRQDDLNMLMILDQLDHRETRHCVEIERIFLRVLDGSCRTPIAALAVLEDDICHFTGLISDHLGTLVLRKSLSGPENTIRGHVQDLAETWREDYGSLIGYRMS